MLVVALRHVDFLGVEPLAEKISMLAKDRKLRMKFSEENRKKARRYDWGTIIPELEKRYLALRTAGPYHSVKSFAFAEEEVLNAG